MKLRVTDDALTALREAEKAVVLGIIFKDGSVRMQIADSQRIPGHLEWIAGEALEGVERGFSVLVKNGRVTALFPLSRLNPAADARLEEAYIQELLQWLPASDDVRLLE